MTPRPETNGPSCRGRLDLAGHALARVVFRGDLVSREFIAFWVKATAASRE
jgi:hypothetical protein